MVDHATSLSNAAYEKACALSDKLQAIKDKRDNKNLQTN